jgi:hypothetical protein
MDKMKYLSFLAAFTGMGASIEGGLPTDPGTLNALAHWPLTTILGAVCVICVYFLYRQSKENSQTMLKMVEGERQATEHRISSNALITKELADNNAKLVRELAEGHAQNLRMLLDEIGKKNKPN